jgi:hypothetical protein
MGRKKKIKSVETEMLTEVPPITDEVLVDVAEEIVGEALTEVPPIDEQTALVDEPEETAPMLTEVKHAPFKRKQVRGDFSKRTLMTRFGIK